MDKLDILLLVLLFLTTVMIVFGIEWQKERESMQGRPVPQVRLI